MENTFNELVKNLTERLNKLGLYMVDVHIMADQEYEKEDQDIDFYKLMLEEKINFMIVGTFVLSQKIAFKDRVLNPEKYEIDKIFKDIIPSKEEMIVNKLKESFEKSGNIEESLSELFNDTDLNKE